MDLWKLEADPGVLETLAESWKAQVKQLSWAADTINAAANRVVGGDAWAGETAERYDQHRRKLVADLDDCAELAGRVGRALGECAQTLRHHELLLNTERLKLANIRSDSAGNYYPANEQETKLVNEAIKVAKEIRNRLDQELQRQLSVFNKATAELNQWKGRWAGRNLRVLNYNIQQGGGGNNFWNRKPGHDPGDFGQLAQRLIDGEVDIATLQEVFRGGAEELQRELNARDPDGKWQVHFGKASDKYQWSNGGIPIIGDTNDFGNAVVVRTGSGVTTGPVTNYHLGSGDEDRGALKVPITVN